MARYPEQCECVLLEKRKEKKQKKKKRYETIMHPEKRFNPNSTILFVLLLSQKCLFCSFVYCPSRDLTATSHETAASFHGLEPERNTTHRTTNGGLRQGLATLAIIVTTTIRPNNAVVVIVTHTLIGSQ